VRNYNELSENLFIQQLGRKTISKRNAMHIKEFHEYVMQFYLIAPFCQAEDYRGDFFVIQNF
jgi:hypothetical protein